MPSRDRHRNQGRQRARPTSPDRRSRAAPTAYQKPIVLAAAFFVLALLIRLAYLQTINANPYFRSPILDEQDNQVWASQIAEGHGRDYLPFYRAPGYPYLLAAVYATTGPDVPAARLLSAVLGSLSVGLTTLIGCALAGPGAAVIAGLLLACYPAGLFFDGMLLSASFDTLLLVAALFLLLAALQAKPSRIPAWAGALGLTLGLATITRPTLAVLLPVALLFLHFRAARRSWRAVAVLAAAWALPVLAVTAVNGAGGGSVFVAWSGGVNFYIGNHAGADGWSVITPELRPSLWQGRSDAIRIASAALGHDTSPAEVSRYWFRRGRDFVTGETPAWLALMGRKIYLLLGAPELSNNHSIEEFRPYSPFLRPPLLGFGLLLALAAPQLFSRRTWTAPLPWFLVAYGGAIVLFFVTARFRLPLVPLLAVLAGRTIIDLATAVRRARWLDAGRLAGIGLAAAVLSYSARAAGADPAAAMQHYALGNRHFNAGEYEQAVTEFEAAVGARGAPRLIQLQALNNIAAARLRQQQPAAARAVLRRSIALEPSPEAYARLGWAYFQEAELDSTRAALERVLAMRADDPEALYYLGHVARQEGDLPEAIALWERAVSAGPDPSQVQIIYYALATLYVQTGQNPERALFLLDRINQRFPGLEKMRAASEAQLRARGAR